MHYFIVIFTFISFFVIVEGGLEKAGLGHFEKKIWLSQDIWVLVTTRSCCHLLRLLHIESEVMIVASLWIMLHLFVTPNIVLTILTCKSSPWILFWTSVLICTTRMISWNMVGHWSYLCASWSGKHRVTRMLERPCLILIIEMFLGHPGVRDDRHTV